MGNLGRLIRGVGPFLPVLELDEEERVVGGRSAREEAVAGHGGEGLDGRIGPEDGLDLGGRGVGSLQRGGVRQLQVGHQVGLILFRHEAAGNCAEQQQQRQHQHTEHGQRTQRAMGEPAGNPDVLIRHPVQHPVEAVEEACKAAFLAVNVRLQQRAAQRRAQCQRNDRRDTHRNGDGDGELLVEPAGDAGHGGHRYEHRNQRKRRGNHRAADLLHGLDGGLASLHAPLHLLRNALHHHDGVVHHDADG